MSTKVSFAPNQYRTEEKGGFVPTDISAIVEGSRTGLLKHASGGIALEEAGKKNALPVVLWQADVMEGTGRKADNCKPNGRVFLDLDTPKALTPLPADLQIVHDRATTNPHTLYFRLSASRKGCRVVARVEPIPQTKEQYSQAAKQVAEQLSELWKGTQLEVDAASFVLTEPDYICSDPDVYWNPDAVALPATYTHVAESTYKRPTASEHKQVGYKALVYGEAVKNALTKLPVIPVPEGMGNTVYTEALKYMALSGEHARPEDIVECFEVLMSKTIDAPCDPNEVVPGYAKLIDSLHAKGVEDRIPARKASQIKRKAESDPDMSDEEVEAWVEEHYIPEEDWTKGFDLKGVHEIPWKLAYYHIFFGGIQRVVMQADARAEDLRGISLWQYHAMTGLYQPDGGEFLMGWLRRYLPLTTVQSIESEFFKSIKVVAGDVCKGSLDRFDQHPTKIVFMNGVYDLESDQFTNAFDPELLATRRIQVPYTSVEDTFVLDRIKEIIPDDQNREFYLTYLAHSMLNTKVVEHFIHLWSPRGKAGKSTLTQIIQGMFGDTQAKTISADLLGTDHGTEGLEYARWLIIPEARGLNNRTTDLLKRIVSREGDRVPVNPKGRPKFSFIPRISVMVLSNDKTYIPQGDEAYSTRVVGIKLTERFEGTVRDPLMVRKIQDPDKLGPFVVGTLIPLAREMALNGGALSSAVEEAIDKVQSQTFTETDLVAHMMERSTTEKKGDHVDVKHLRKIYQSLCIDRGVSRQLSRKSFLDRLQDFGYKKYQCNHQVDAIVDISLTPEFRQWIESEEGRNVDA